MGYAVQNGGDHAGIGLYQDGIAHPSGEKSQRVVTGGACEKGGYQYVIFRTYRTREQDYEALGVGADELLWGIAHPSESLLEIWDRSDQKASDIERQDSYSMYVRIMKSVAEIMNEA